MTATVSGVARERLVAIAERAGRAVLAHYRADVTVERKADASPVTAADHAAHRVIADALADWDPGTPVVSEEGPPPREPPEGRFWLVDPLDGTKEFLAGNGEFTVNIALVEGGEPVLGVVHAPALGLTYSAGRGLGAWRAREGRPAERIFSVVPRPAEPLVVAESRSHPSAALEAYLAGLPVARRVRVGSSLKFGWVADGTATLYPRLGPTMEWDVAAGDCVFRNSGRDGPRASPLRYGKPGFRNASFVLGGAPDPPGVAHVS